MWSVLLPAALGAYEGEQKRIAHNKDIKTQAEKDRFSKWTGLKGQVTTENGDWLGGAVKGGLAGYLGNKDMDKNEAMLARDMPETEYEDDSGDEDAPLQLDANGNGPMSKEVKNYRSAKDLETFGQRLDNAALKNQNTSSDLFKSGPKILRSGSYTLPEAQKWNEFDDLDNQPQRKSYGRSEIKRNV